MRHRASASPRTRRLGDFGGFSRLGLGGRGGDPLGRRRFQQGDQLILAQFVEALQALLSGHVQEFDRIPGMLRRGRQADADRELQRRPLGRDGSPSQAGHQPSQVLNEKLCGVSGSKLRPQRSQAKCWLWISVSQRDSG